MSDEPCDCDCGFPMHGTLEIGNSGPPNPAEDSPYGHWMFDTDGRWRWVAYKIPVTFEGPVVE